MQAGLYHYHVLTDYWTKAYPHHIHLLSVLRKFHTSSWQSCLSGKARKRRAQSVIWRSLCCHPKENWWQKCQWERLHKSPTFNIQWTLQVIPGRSTLQIKRLNIKQISPRRFTQTLAHYLSTLGHSFQAINWWYTTEVQLLCLSFLSLHTYIHLHMHRERERAYFFFKQLCMKETYLHTDPMFCFRLFSHCTRINFDLVTTDDRHLHKWCLCASGAEQQCLTVPVVFCCGFFCGNSKLYTFKFPLSWWGRQKEMKDKC